ncbi:MAG: hypothetical protein Q9196_001759, partial [Gyalolechia fulgens]
MTSIDPAVASVLDTHPHRDKDGSSAASDDEADLLDSLDNDPSLSGYRAQRLQQLHEEFTRAKHLRNCDHGQYTEIRDEKPLMDIVNTGAELCVVHFFKPDFRRCGIMDGHLRKLAPLHTDTRFLRIDVGNAPFL